MIDRAEIDRAFEVCLRRAPGGEEAYAFFTSLNALDDVYATLFDSPEFRGRLVPAVADKGAAPLDVEMTAAPDMLARMVAHVEATWTELGNTEPHWSVITEPRFKAAQIDGNRELFREYGRVDDAWFAQACARAGVDLAPLETCFELGCGTGRITEFLARRFARVIAADISQAHLAAARAALSGHANVTLLHVSRLDDLDRLPAFDMLYTRIVLQHNPPPLIAVILSSLLGRLAPGGAAYVQVPVWIPEYRFSVSRYLAGLQTGPMEMHALPQRDLLRIVRQSGCAILELREDPLGPQFGGISNTVVLQKA